MLPMVESRYLGWKKYLLASDLVLGKILFFEIPREMQSQRKTASATKWGCKSSYQNFYANYFQHFCNNTSFDYLKEKVVAKCWSCCWGNTKTDQTNDVLAIWVVQTTLNIFNQIEFF